MTNSKKNSRLIAVLLSMILIFVNFAMPVSGFAAEAVASTPEAYMQTYLSKKIVSNGGDSIVRSADGLSYDVALKTPNGFKNTSLRFNTPASTDPYKMTWTVAEKDAAYISGASLSNRKNIDKRPADEPAYPAVITIGLYDKAVSDADITGGKVAPLVSKDITFRLAPAEAIYDVTFDVVDQSTKAKIPNPTISVSKSWSSMQPENGVYKLPKGEVYTLEVTASGYVRHMNPNFTATKNGAVTIELEPMAPPAPPSITDYKVKFDVKDEAGKAIADAKIKVTYEEEDPWGWGTTTVDAKPDSKGVYTLNKYTDYSYEISAPGYVTEKKAVYNPSGDKADITVSVVLIKETPEQKKVDALKAQYDKEYGALRPNFTTDKNICEVVLEKLKGYAGLDSTGVTVTVATSKDEAVIAKDGKINYVNKNDLNAYMHSKNVGCTFNIVCGKAKATTTNRTVTVGWDRDHFNNKIVEESKLLTVDKILGENKSAAEVTKDLTLPRCMGTSVSNVWATAEWETSNPDVISIVKPSVDSPKNPCTGKVKPTDKDTVVTLTATFKANSSVLNSYLEKPADFKPAVVKFDVTVKGTGPAKPTPESLTQLLDKYYTAASLKDSITGEVIDTQNVKGDIQLPRYTRIKDENGKLVFNNKEIQVKSSNSKLVSINGYRANVDPFTKENPNVDLIIEFTRDTVKVEKRIPLKIAAVTDAELDAEIAKMDLAKKHYFDGINDGRYQDADSVTGNLHPFQEMRLDKVGKPLWIYTAKDFVGDGIIADDFFDDSWVMEGAGYNKFKSSDNMVVRHDNLVVTQPEKTKKVEISSLLSSAKYGKYAKAHPENAKLQKLYKQEVKVTVTVKGTKPEGEVKPDVAKTVDLNITGAPGMKFETVPFIGKVSSDEAVKAGYVKVDKYKNEVTVIDALVVLHRAMYGEAFDKNPKDYLDMSAQGWLTKIFGVATSNCGYLVNGKTPVYPDNPSMGSVANDTVLASGDSVAAFIYNDTTAWSDMYLEFTAPQINGKTGEKITLTLQGLKPMSYPLTDTMAPKAGYTVRLESVSDKNVYYEAVTDEKGQVVFTVDKAGKYKATVVAGAEYFIRPHALVCVEEAAVEPKPEVTVKPGWNLIDGNWYYMNEAGAKLTGWQQVSGTWYYLDGSGAMKTGWLKQGANWYYLNGSGAMATGWAKVGNTWYYMNGSGVMQTGWQKVSGTWYYLDGSGAMKTGWLKQGVNWYYLNGSGAMATGWAKVGNTWYYMNGSGIMQTGWQKISGTWYYLDGSGAMLTGWQHIDGTWYYLDNSGAMVTGTHYIDGVKYTFASNGAML